MIRSVKGVRGMAGDTIVIVVAIVGTGIGTGAALGPLIVPGLREMRRDISDLRERMARLEGRFDEMSCYIATITGRREGFAEESA